MSVAKSNLNISAVTVTGIIHGTSSIPRIDFAKAKRLLKNSAKAKPIRNWNIRQSKLGSYMAMGMSLGLVTGCAVGYALSHMVVGMCIGTVIGMCFGTVIGKMKVGK